MMSLRIDEAARDLGAEVYDAAAAADAWSRTLPFFRRELDMRPRPMLLAAREVESHVQRAQGVHGR